MKPVRTDRMSVGEKRDILFISQFRDDLTVAMPCFNAIITGARR